MIEKVCAGRGGGVTHNKALCTFTKARKTDTHARTRTGMGLVILLKVEDICFEMI